MASVLEQVADIVKQGYREIVLTGVHLGGTGRDLKPASSLSDIVEQVAAVPGLERLRISSVDPNEIDTRLIALVADNPTVCRICTFRTERIGSDSKDAAALQTADFRRIVESVSSSHEIAITTDVIVGFSRRTPNCLTRLMHFCRKWRQARFMSFNTHRGKGLWQLRFLIRCPNRKKSAGARL